MDLTSTKLLAVICACVLLASCNQPKPPVIEQPLPFQEKMRALCDVYRTDLYNFAEKAATTRLDSEFKESLYAAESATKLMDMLNCKRWNPS
ncbi:MAG TPA: hypothetical protein VKT22_07515 [Steroidobacteraceae bacterium]|nr:hypothetical protein [Steroidobacteraceae bacterium]